MPTPLMPGDEMVAPDGVVARMIRTTAGSSPAALEVEWTVPPGERLVAIPHRHPPGPEEWRVVAGTARYRVAWGRARVATAPGGWTVPADTMHVHPANAGDDVLVVRQIIAPDPPEPALTGGIERYFETFFAAAQRGGVDRFGRIKDPLQDVISLWHNLVPGSYIAGIPTFVQRPLLRLGAALAARRGREPWLAAERRRSASSSV
jgi:quercetin dioxygenase-like cupin family protein